MDSEYIIKGAKPWEAKIYSDDDEIAEIKKGEGPTFRLISKDGREWTISNQVHGEMHPFSLTVRQDQNKGKTDSNKDVLTIREHLRLWQGVISRLHMSELERQIHFLV